MWYFFVNRFIEKYTFIKVSTTKALRDRWRTARPVGTVRVRNGEHQSQDRVKCIIMVPSLGGRMRSSAEGLKLTRGLPQYQDLTFCVHPPKLDRRPPRYPLCKHIRAFMHSWYSMVPERTIAYHKLPLVKELLAYLKFVRSQFCKLTDMMTERLPDIFFICWFWLKINLYVLLYEWFFF